MFPTALSSAFAVSLLFAGVSAQATAPTLTAAQIAAQSSPYVAATYTNWTVINVPMNTCVNDTQCAYLGSAPYNLVNPCCASWSNTTGNTTTSLGNACIGKDIDFYSATFQTGTAGATQIYFNCTMQPKWLNYTAASWLAVNQTACASNSVCSSGQCCNNNNASYMGMTNSNWEPDNYCMANTSDTMLWNFTSNITGINFQIEQMCLSTANTIAGISNTPATNATTTATKSSAQQLLLSVALAVLLAFFY